MMSTFAEIEKAAQDADREILDLVCSARENANDTVYVEKAADKSEADQIAMSSLESLLCECSDPTLTSWFAAHGVRW